MSGTIELYQKEELIRRLDYKHEAHKKKILANWKLLYGKGMKRCEVIDIPDPKKIALRKANKGSFKKGNAYQYGKIKGKIQNESFGGNLSKHIYITSK